MVIKISWKKFENIVGISISVFAFIVYLTTLCPTINFIDSGELSTVAYTLGISHPTGYPLFSIISWIFAHLPLGFRVIYKLNLMAALFCSLGLFFFFRLLVFLLNDFLFRGNKLFDNNSTISEKSVFHVFIPAVFGTLVLAFSETYWSQALSIEVYSLHVFFLSIILLLFTKAIFTELSQVENVVKAKHPMYWNGFALALGLSFTNHMTTILFAPAFLYLYFYSFRFSSRAWIQIIQLIPSFLIGFSAYLYLPIRASQHPIMNWGNPVDLEKLFWHFGAKQYRVWIFSSTESAAKQFNYFIDSLPSEFAYFPLVLAIIGLWNLIKYNKHLFIFTSLLFLGCLLYSINYDIHDIDSYFLLAYFTIAIWSAFGSYQVIQLFKYRHSIRFAGGVLLGLILIIPIHNYNRVDESKNSFVENYSRDMLNSVEPNGIIISYQWDYFVSAAYYLQIVEHVRPDVVVIDKELLRRSWYYNQLSCRYPWLVAQSKKEIEEFLKELYKFEHNQSYNANVIEHYYSKVILSFIEKNYSTKPIYVTPEIEEKYTARFARVPSGLSFRLYADTVLHELLKPKFNLIKTEQKDTYIDGIISQYAQAYTNYAIYSNLLNKKADAILFLDSALNVQPNSREAIYLKNRLVGF